MIYLWIIIAVIAFLLIASLSLAYYCYRTAFYSPKRKSDEMNYDFEIHYGEIYKPYKDIMAKWRNEAKNIGFEEVSITSFDGLKLFGKYYECEKGAPMEIMFHGYRGNSERDMCGGIRRAFSLGRNVLLVDQRACGKSEGKVITFGINESRDCADWVNFAVNHFGKDVKIIITGISMGAATVLTATRFDLPENVVGVLADCGYTSAKDIIKIVIKSMKLPADLAYPFVKLGARIFGHFKLEEYSPIEAMKTCKIPVVFIHGDDDGFVPAFMSKENYDACIAPKKLTIIKNAEHGLSYLIDPETYLDTLIEFAPVYGVPVADSRKFN